MNVEVFFCSVDDSGGETLRGAMAHLCLTRWLEVEGVDVIPLSDGILGCSAIGFQRIRRIYADEHSCGDVYIVADDDCLLPANFSLDECVRIFKASRFATLSMMPSNATINEWTPQGYVTENTPDVMEHVSAGNIRFCRKGHLANWPLMGDGPGYDAIHADAIRKQGGRVGYFRSMRSLHLGEGMSSIWDSQKVDR